MKSCSKTWLLLLMALSTSALAAPTGLICTAEDKSADILFVDVDEKELLVFGRWDNDTDTEMTWRSAENFKADRVSVSGMVRSRASIVGNPETRADAYTTYTLDRVTLVLRSALQLQIDGGEISNEMPKPLKQCVLSDIEIDTKF